MTSRRKSPWINGPESESQNILNIGLDHVNSVPYKVSLRWVFYRLYQNGLYKTKNDDAWEIICSRARHTRWGAGVPTL